MTLTELKDERNKAAAAIIGAIEGLMEYQEKFGVGVSVQALKPYIERYYRANEAVKREIVKGILE